MSIPLFKDLNKRNSDFFSKDFPVDQKVEWKGKTANGVETEVLFNKAGDKVTGTYKPKYVANGTEYLLEAKTDRNAKLEISNKDQIAKGLKVAFAENYNEKDGLFGALNFEYKHESAVLTAGADFGKAAGSTVTASAVVKAQGLLVGGNVSYLGSQLTGWNGAVAFANADYDLQLFGRQQQDKATKLAFREVGVAYFHNVSKEFTVASTATYNVDIKDVAPTLVAGVQYKPAAESAIKAAFGTDGQVQLSYKQKYNDRVSFTVGTSFHSSFKPEKSSAGFSLNLTD